MTALEIAKGLSDDYDVLEFLLVEGHADCIDILTPLGLEVRAILEAGDA